MESVGKPMLQLMVERVLRTPSLDGVVIATTTNESDDPICEIAEKMGIGFYRGSEDDVLDRVLKTAHAHDIDIIVELCGDCPLIDPTYIEVCIQDYKTTGVDYVSSALSQSFPAGTEAQVFSRDVLDDVARRTDDPVDHEHVSLFIYRNPDLYSIRAVEAPVDVCQPDLHLTLDEPKDFTVINGIFEALYNENPQFGLKDILALKDKQPNLFMTNSDVKRTVV